MEAAPGAAYHIWTVPVEISDDGVRAGQPEAFLQTQPGERHPRFSPDGRWLAYSSNESGTFQAYVRNFPDQGRRWQVSNNGGLYPEWSGNGRELFFRTEDNRVMVAGYTVKDGAFVADKPRAWSETRLADLGLNLNFTVARDGKRVAGLIPVQSSEEDAAQHHVIFLMNFLDELQRRVPQSSDASK
jgi:serine/threonine-protein kinase